MKKYGLKDITPQEHICGPIVGCPSVYEIVKECMVGPCPAIYEIAKECAFGPCPAVYEIAKECGVAVCPSIFGDPENRDVYLIIGKKVKAEDFEGLAGKVAADEDVVAVPKSLIAKLLEKNKA